MNQLIKKISHEISEDLNNYHSYLKNALKSDVKLINTILKYVMRIKGKQFRPILCILTAKLIGKPNEITYLSAATVEILHVATLLHDDVVDESDIRRGWPTVNVIWKSKLSILIGDYLFSKSLNNISKLDNIELINLLANISDRLSEGEILQIEYAMKKNMPEEVYFKMISDKTASLISASCKLGIMSINNDEKKHNIERFGEYLGIAYQLKDDLFDVLGKIDDIGKPTQLDLKKNMLTLPYIHMLNTIDNKVKKNIIRKLKYYIKKQDLNKVKNLIIKYGGIEYTEQKINDYTNKAINELTVFDDSKYKSLLIEMLEFNLSRNY